MTRILTAVFLILTLASCEAVPYDPGAGILYAPPPLPPAGSEPSGYSPNFDATFGTAPDVSTDLANPQILDTSLDIGTARPPEGAMLDQLRAACTREGGQFMPRGTGFFACVHRTQDAGRQCTASSDCEGMCLARSRTCAPMQPLFGCQEVFTTVGRRETVCTE